MREMKNSGVEWIGEIPKDWKLGKAKRFIRITNGSNPTIEGNIPVYGSGKKPFATCGNYKSGSAVLLGRKGTIDNPTYIEGLYWNVDTVFDVKVTRDDFLIKYYYYLSTCFDYKFYMTQTAIPSMTQTNYNNIFIPFPPLSEQTAIASYLDKKCSNIDAIITKNEQIIEKLKEYKSSLISEAVTKGLNPDVKMKNSGVEWIGEMPAEWKAIKLKYVIKIENGINPQTEGNIPVYGSGSESFKTCGEYKEGPAVLLGRKGTINIPRYIEGKYWNVDTVFSVTTISFMLKLKFFYYVSTCFDYFFYNLQTTLPSMTQTNYNNMFIPLPPLTEQIAIAAYLDEKCSKIDANIKKRELIIQKLAEYKKSIIYEVVTGKKEAVYRQCFIRKIEGEIKNGNIFKSE